MDLLQLFLQYFATVNRILEISKCNPIQHYHKRQPPPQTCCIITLCTGVQRFKHHTLSSAVDNIGGLDGVVYAANMQINWNDKHDQL